MKLTFDLDGLKRQIEQVKQKVYAGVIDGFNDADGYLEGIMKFYIEKEVYAVYNPLQYQRTYDLRDNVTASVIGDSIFVYVNDQGMDRTPDGVTYPFRVLEGHAVHPYEHVPKDGSWAGYMDARDWITPTKMEFINHMKMSKVFMDIVIQAVQRRLG
jgi:hypothetical protein